MYYIAPPLPLIRSHAVLPDACKSSCKIYVVKTGRLTSSLVHREHNLSLSLSLSLPLSLSFCFSLSLSWWLSACWLSIAMKAHALLYAILVASNSSCRQMAAYPSSWSCDCHRHRHRHLRRHLSSFSCSSPVAKCKWADELISMMSLRAHVLGWAYAQFRFILSPGGWVLA